MTALKCGGSPGFSGGGCDTESTTPSTASRAMSQVAARHGLWPWLNVTSCRNSTLDRAGLDRAADAVPSRTGQHGLVVLAWR